MTSTPPLDLGPLAAATAGLTTPYAVVDLDAFDANATSMAGRAHGLPIRIASKSLRCRALMDRALTGAALTSSSSPGFRGVLAYSVVEALWLARHGHTDVLVGYPTVDLEALTELGQDPELAAAVTVMIDSRAHLDLIDRAAPVHPVRVAIDVDASLRLGPLHLGVRRSPVHTAEETGALAAQITRHRDVRLVGLMLYDAQIAGLPDASAAVRLVKRISEAELARRRAAVLAAVRPHADLEFVNGGGTGSLHLTSVAGQLSELAGGSGLYGPGLFDFYRAFRPVPAAYFVLPVVRRPSSSVATLLGGGWVASGPLGKDRLPTLAWPLGLRVTATESFGEVQTPLVGKAASVLRVGDRVWLRHAKAGELCERIGDLHLVSGGAVVDTVPTFRGEGHHFL
jgi:D-serine deaminase-like pyridoxal phosphate-dependent protein